MDILGYPLTWKTRCFIRSGCRKMVFAHTNGYGDFVLLDSLGWPWPIHECYLQRCGGGDDATLVNISQSKGIAYGGALAREWDTVVPITPNAAGPRKRFTFIGTVTNTENGFVGRSAEFRGLSRTSEEEVRRVLAGRRSLVTIVTGDGAEFTAFIDLDKTPVRFRDIVAADVKAVSFLNTSVFVVTQIRAFPCGG